ncbi:MAG: ferrous iron transporter B, partial [Proteobacteria bacterium]
GIAARVLADTPADRTLLLQVLDVTQLALGLRLTKELLAQGRPLLVVATQKDLLEEQGKSIDPKALERALGVPVVLVSARDAGARAAVLAAVAAHPLTTCRAPAEALEPARLARTVLGTSARSVRTQTDRIDRFLLHPVLGPVLFLSILTVAFAAVFLVAEPVTSTIDGLMEWLSVRVTSALGDGLLASFLNDGILAGAGTVLIFMPQIVILTVVLDLLEASGYLARGAFLIDRVLRALGLSGRAFIPLLMGHACAVPAIGATRILRDPRERLTTMLVLPLMTCSARIPTYGLLLAAFFGHRSAFFRAGVFVFLYFAGIAAGCIAAVVIQRGVVKGKSLPLVLEIPIYRAPQARLVARKAWRTAKRFLRDVGTVIVVASAVLYVLLNVPVRAAREGEPLIERSVAAQIGKGLEPVTRQAGFDWRINVGLIASFGARELMVGTMGVIMGVEKADDDPAPLAERLHDATREDGTPLYSGATAAALLAFFVLACQCMSTVAALRRETKSLKWPLFVLGYTYVAAFVAAVVTYRLTLLLS